MKRKPESVKEEYELAMKEDRQPNCIYCGKPLEVRQIQYTDLTWKWCEKGKRYYKIEDVGCADKPFCAYCGEHDWDFIDENLVSF